MQKILSTIVLGVMLVAGLGLLMAPVAPASAATTTITADSLGLSYAAETGLASTDVRTTISRIIRVAMGLLGIVAVVIILIGGFTWMTAGGNEEKVGEAKKWIFAGVIGLAIILSAYALASFVINQLVNATTGTNLP
jgi:hypothetical protein